MLVLIDKSSNQTTSLIRKAYELFCRVHNREQKNIEVIYEDKKPVISGDELFCSVSHSGAYAVCVISKDVVGIDIEQIKDRDFGALSKRYFNTIVLDSSSFYAKWTISEAKFKATGEHILDLLKTEITDVKVFDFIPQYILAIYSKNIDDVIFSESAY